jgi:hypothetical protein
LVLLPVLTGTSRVLKCSESESGPTHADGLWLVQGSRQTTAAQWQSPTASDLEGRDGGSYGAVSRRQKWDQSFGVVGAGSDSAARTKTSTAPGVWPGLQPEWASEATGKPRDRILNVGDSQDPPGTVRLALRVRGLLLLRAVRRHVALLLSPGLMFARAGRRRGHRVLLSKEEEARMRPGPPSILAETKRAFRCGPAPRSLPRLYVCRMRARRLNVSESPKGGRRGCGSKFFSIQ